MKKVLLIGGSVLTVLVLVVALVPQLRMMATVSFLNMITTTSFEVDANNPEHLLVSGEINSKSFKQLKAVIKENPEITTLVLLDVPGSLNDDVNLKMCHWIRDQGFNTYIKKDGHVASGGTDLFIAGNKRYYEEGAKLGVHSWQDGINEAKDLPKDHKDHKMFIDYTEKMLGSADFYWYTIYAAPAADIYYMTPEEIAKYGMYTHKVE